MGERRRKTNCKFMQSRKRQRERRGPSVSSYFDAGKTEGRCGAIKKENGQIHPGRFSNRWIPYSFCSFSLILPRSSLSNLEIFSPLPCCFHLFFLLFPSALSSSLCRRALQRKKQCKSRRGSFLFARRKREWKFFSQEKKLPANNASWWFLEDI